MRSALLLIPAFLVTLSAAARGQDDDLEPIPVVKLDRKEPVTYEKDVLPILAAKCQVCHKGKIREGQLDLGTYESLMKGGKHGRPIVPGKPDESLLIQLAGHTKSPPMPPETEEPLEPKELALLKLWVAQGAKGPTGKIASVKKTYRLGPLPPRLVPVVALAVSHDKSTVAAGRGNHIHIYDAGSGKYIRSLVNPRYRDAEGRPLGIAHRDIVQSLRFSPDGRLLASGGFQNVVIWDVQTGQVRRELTGFADRVVALDFSPDGNWLATGGGPPSENGEIKVFDVRTGKLIVDIENGHSDTVYGVAFSPDGTKLATGSADKFVKVFELPSGKFLKSFEGHTHHVLDVGWKSDGKTLASCGADNVIKVWDYERGEQKRTINAHGRQVTRMVFIGKTSQVATASGDARVRFWNVDNGGRVRDFGGNKDFLYAVDVTPDGQLVAAGGQESVVRLYNGANGQLKKTLVPPGVEPPK